MSSIYCGTASRSARSEKRCARLTVSRARASGSPANPPLWTGGVVHAAAVPLCSGTGLNPRGPEACLGDRRLHLSNRKTERRATRKTQNSCKRPCRAGARNTAQQRQRQRPKREPTTDPTRGPKDGMVKRTAPDCTPAPAPEPSPNPASRREQQEGAELDGTRGGQRSRRLKAQTRRP